MEYEIKNGKLIINIESIIQDIKDINEDLIKENKDKLNFVKDVSDSKFAKSFSKTVEENIPEIVKSVQKSNEIIKNDEYKEEKEGKDFGFGDIKTNEKFNTNQLLITTSTNTKQDIGQISDLDNEIFGYDRIRIFDSIGRKSEKINLINDGPDIMYAIVNRTGVDDDSGIWTHQSNEELEKTWVTTQDKIKESWSTNEIMIYPGEKAIITNDIYEIRVRSPTQGNKYRVMEDDIIGNTIRQVM